MIGEHEYGYRFARSRNGRLTGEDAEWLLGDRSGEEYGFASLAATAENEIGAIWPEGREMRGHGMQLRFRLIGSQHLRDEIVLDDRTCECCAADLIWTEQGPVAVYRDREPEEIWDIYAVSLDRNPKRVARDEWKKPGCPVNGLAIDSYGGLTAMA